MISPCTGDNGAQAQPLQRVIKAKRFLRPSGTGDASRLNHRLARAVLAVM